MKRQKRRPIIILESPFRARSSSEEATYLLYLRRALRDSWQRGEHPLASHAYYPFFLSESNPEERKAGIEAGYALWPLADSVIFYLDYGMSEGMDKALDRAVHAHLCIQTRTIGVNP